MGEKGIGKTTAPSLAEHHGQPPFPHTPPVLRQSRCPVGVGSGLGAAAPEVERLGADVGAAVRREVAADEAQHLGRAVRRVQHRGRAPWWGGGGEGALDRSGREALVVEPPTNSFQNSFSVPTVKFHQIRSGIPSGMLLNPVCWKNSATVCAVQKKPRTTVISETWGKLPGSH